MRAEEAATLAPPRLRDVAALGASSTNVHGGDTSTLTHVCVSDDGVVNHGCDDSSMNHRHSNIVTTHLSHDGPSVSSAQLNPSRVMPGPMAQPMGRHGTTRLANRVASTRLLSTRPFIAWEVATSYHLCSPWKEMEARVWIDDWEYTCWEENSGRCYSSNCLRSSKRKWA